jgi:hypothetical protein
MFRAKIGLVVAAVVLILTGGVYLSLTSRLSESARTGVESQLRGSARVFAQIARAEAYDFTNIAIRFAHDDEFLKALAMPDVTERRRQLFVAVQARNARLGAEARKADIIAVTDSSGRVLVRDLDPNVMFGEDLRSKFRSLGLALSGTPNKDTWFFDHKPMRVASAPIRATDNRVLGAILVGYVITDKEARAKKQDVGAEVAYALDNRLIATSFTVTGEAEKEDAERAQELGKLLFGAASPAGDAIHAEKTSEIFPVRLRGEDFLAIAEFLPGNSTNKGSGVILLRSLAQTMLPVTTAGNFVLLLGGLALLTALGASVLTARRFLSPLDQLETGVAEVINGNLDYSFTKPSPDYEGLANALNVMLARLLGRPEPAEDEDGDQAMARRWKADGMFEDVDAASAAGGAVQDQASLALAQEPLDAYFRRTFDEYIAAKRQLGERVDGVTPDSFRAKLAQNETALKGKYRCRMVRFRVQVRGNQVTLKPIPIY